jgi:hypothetical protein
MRTIALFVLTLLTLPTIAPVAHAQTRAAGLSFSSLSLTYPERHASGIAGWLTMDFVDSPGPFAGIDLAATFFPDDHPVTGRHTQLLGGVRAGAGMGHVRLSGRARAGVAHFSRRFYAPDVPCILIFPPPEACLTGRTNLALDFGGTLEVPIDRYVLRFDGGDTAIRFSRTNFDAAWKHNLQLSGGFGVRF